YLLDGHFYLYNHFRPIAYTLTQLFQEVTPYINNFVSISEKEIHAGLYREYGELVTLLNTNIILQEAAKELHPHDSRMLSDVEQEVNDEETNYLSGSENPDNFEESFDKLTNQFLPLGQLAPNEKLKEIPELI
ncbi:6473_t:CDS:2, partial [Dentiscutata erythropus]